MTADLSALIARLEAAEVGSRELDAHVEVAARAFEAAKTGLAREHWAVWRASPSGIVGDGGTQYASAPVTTSLDAALALAERVLPEETFWEMSHNAVINGQRMYHADVFPPYQSGEATFCGYGPHPALALCTAILRAKQGEEE